MFTRCSLYVHYMFTICSLSVHYMLAKSQNALGYRVKSLTLKNGGSFMQIFKVYFHYLFTICSLHVHYMFTICSVNVIVNDSFPG